MAPCCKNTGRRNELAIPTMCVALFRRSKSKERRWEAKSNNSFPSVKIASNLLVIPTAAAVEAIKQLEGGLCSSMTNLMTGALPITQSMFPKSSHYRAYHTV